MIINTHSHTFTIDHVPDRFLPLGLSTLLRTGFLRRSFLRITDSLWPFSNKDQLSHYARFVELTYQKSQSDLEYANERRVPLITHASPGGIYYKGTLTEEMRTHPQTGEVLPRESNRVFTDRFADSRMDPGSSPKPCHHGQNASFSSPGLQHGTAAMTRLRRDALSSRRAAERGIAHWFALVILVLGIGLLTGAWFAYSASVEKRDTFSRAEGVVTDFFVDWDSDEGADVYYPIVDFTTAGGQRVRFKHSVGTGYSPGYDEGAQIPVLYDPENPKDALIESFTGLWMAPIILCILGLAATAWGVALAWLVLQDPPWGKEKRARSQEKRPLRPPLPWPQLIPVTLLGLAAGAAAAIYLPYLPGAIWITAIAPLAFIAGIRVLLGGGFVWKAILIICALQIPGVALRLAIGDPEARVARAVVEELDIELQSGVDLSKPLNESRVITPENPALPAFLDDEGIRYGVQDGRFVVVFSRTFFGFTETHTYDPATGEWEKTEWEDTTPLDEVNVYAP